MQLVIKMSIILISILLNIINYISTSSNISSVLSIKPRMITNNNNNPPRIQHEAYKAIVGETVRLECPQPSPTWFFRNQMGVEDLIVTRHGIINGDYKYKIMCHMTLKHKVIIINNIDFDEEGLYTCLYTLPSAELASKSLSNEASDLNTVNPNTVQYRYVFNVTVYSKD